MTAPQTPLRPAGATPAGGARHCPTCRCGRPVAMKRSGECRACYERRRRRNPVGKRPDIDQFMERVQASSALDCWVWTGGKAVGGYGWFYRPASRGGRLMAHRWAYEYFRAPIPDGLVIDHLCRTPACVNPWHLEPVTIAVNSLRGEAPCVQRWRADRCKRGHDLTKAYIRKDTGARMCRECARSRR